MNVLKTSLTFADIDIQNLRYEFKSIYLGHPNIILSFIDYSE